jgi:hypothetical protein
MTHTAQLIRDHGLPEAELGSEGSGLGSEEREAELDRLYDEILKQKTDEFMRMIETLYKLTNDKIRNLEKERVIGKKEDLAAKHSTLTGKIFK